MAKAEKLMGTVVKEVEEQVGVTLELTMEEAGAVRELLGGAIWWSEGEGRIIEDVYGVLVNAQSSDLLPEFTLRRRPDDRPILTRDDA